MTEMAIDFLWIANRRTTEALDPSTSLATNNTTTIGIPITWSSASMYRFHKQVHMGRGSGRGGSKDDLAFRIRVIQQCHRNLLLKDCQ